jgi:hypothetical protein
LKNSERELWLHAISSDERVSWVRAIEEWNQSKKASATPVKEVFNRHWEIEFSQVTFSFMDPMSP